VGVNMKLDMDFVTVGSEGSTQRQAFEKLLKQDMANATGISEASIKLKNISQGSVMIDAELENTMAGPDPYSAAMDMKQQARDPESKLRSGGLTGTIVSISVRDTKTLQETVSHLEKQVTLKHNSLDLAQREHGELTEKLKLEHANSMTLSSQLIAANEQVLLSLLHTHIQHTITYTHTTHYYIHTYNTYTHTHIQHIHTYTHAYVYKHTSVCIHTYTHANMYNCFTYMYTYVRVYRYLCVIHSLLAIYTHTFLRLKAIT
jgi:hypothetical protein